MKRYEIKLTGQTPLLMHQDNVAFSEKVKAWQKDPANKQQSVAGDDRSPAWTWIGYLYHDGKVIGMPSDNLMTMLREGGAKVASKGKATYKKQTQAGIMLDQQQFDLLVDGATISVDPFKKLIGNLDFGEHLKAAEESGFELNVKRAVVGRAKHVRVRPMFRDWTLCGSLTVLDEEQSGLTYEILETILKQAGSLCGLGDWRPSSGASGTFGRFSVEVSPIK